MGGMKSPKTTLPRCSAGARANLLTYVRRSDKISMPHRVILVFLYLFLPFFLSSSLVVHALYSRPTPQPSSPSEGSRRRISSRGPQGGAPDANARPPSGAPAVPATPRTRPTLAELRHALRPVAVGTVPSNPTRDSTASQKKKRAHRKRRRQQKSMRTASHRGNNSLRNQSSPCPAHQVRVSVFFFVSFPYDLLLTKHIGYSRTSMKRRQQRSHKSTLSIPTLSSRLLYFAFIWQAAKKSAMECYWIFLSSSLVVHALLCTFSSHSIRNATEVSPESVGYAALAARRVYRLVDWLWYPARRPVVLSTRWGVEGGVVRSVAPSHTRASGEGSHDSSGGTAPRVHFLMRWERFLLFSCTLQVMAYRSVRQTQKSKLPMSGAPSTCQRFFFVSFPYDLLLTKHIGYSRTSMKRKQQRSHKSTLSLFPSFPPLLIQCRTRSETQLFIMKYVSTISHCTHFVLSCLSLVLCNCYLMAAPSENKDHAAPQQSQSAPILPSSAASPSPVKRQKCAGGHIITLACEHCGKQFTGHSTFSGVRSNFRRHVITHSAARPFACDVCGTAFLTKQNMERHKRAKHPEYLGDDANWKRRPTAMTTASRRRRGPLEGTDERGGEEEGGDRQAEAALVVNPDRTKSPDGSEGTDAPYLHPSQMAPGQPSRPAAEPRAFECLLCRATFASKPHLTRHMHRSCPFKEMGFFLADGTVSAQGEDGLNRLPLSFEGLPPLVLQEAPASTGPLDMMLLRGRDEAGVGVVGPSSPPSPLTRSRHPVVPVEPTAELLLRRQGLLLARQQRSAELKRARIERRLATGPESEPAGETGPQALDEIPLAQWYLRFQRERAGAVATHERERSACLESSSGEMKEEVRAAGTADGGDPPSRKRERETEAVPPSTVGGAPKPRLLQQFPMLCPVDGCMHLLTQQSYWRKHMLKHHAGNEAWSSRRGSRANLLTYVRRSDKISMPHRVILVFLYLFLPFFLSSSLVVHAFSLYLLLHQHSLKHSKIQRVHSNSTSSAEVKRPLIRHPPSRLACPPMEVTPSSEARSELLSWLNAQLPEHIPPLRKVEQCGSGVPYLVLLPYLLPSEFARLTHSARVKMNATHEFEMISNWKVLQETLQKHNINKPASLEDPTKLIKGNFQANLSLLQWFKGFADQIMTGGPQAIAPSAAPEPQHSTPTASGPNSATNRRGKAAGTPPSGAPAAQAPAAATRRGASGSACTPRAGGGTGARLASTSAPNAMPRSATTRLASSSSGPGFGTTAGKGQRGAPASATVRTVEPMNKRESELLALLNGTATLPVDDGASGFASPLSLSVASPSQGSIGPMKAGADQRSSTPPAAQGRGSGTPQLATSGSESVSGAAKSRSSTGPGAGVSTTSTGTVHRQNYTGSSSTGDPSAAHSTTRVGPGSRGRTDAGSGQRAKTPNKKRPTTAVQQQQQQQEEEEEVLNTIESNNYLIMATIPQPQPQPQPRTSLSGTSGTKRPMSATAGAAVSPITRRAASAAAGTGPAPTTPRGAAPRRTATGGITATSTSTNAPVAPSQPNGGRAKSAGASVGLKPSPAMQNKSGQSTPPSGTAAAPKRRPTTPASPGPQPGLLLKPQRKTPPPAGQKGGDGGVGQVERLSTPNGTAAAAAAAHRAGPAPSRDPNSFLTPVVDLSDEEAAEVALQQTATERQFYYDKLRMIERLVVNTAAKDLRGADVAAVALARSIRDVLYATN
eukprot:gene3940-2803_t